ncbi:MAG: hypothetical protein PHP44_01755, partial [Kiritimatiellae bacterium]|nr:hypothetical protein [Kiritimatiellia bacterium]
VDEQYSMVSEVVNGAFVPTNAAQPTFWPNVPDYDPNKPDYKSANDGGRQEFYAYMRGTNLAVNQDVDVYFGARLMVENPAFPSEVCRGLTVNVPVEWEHLPEEVDMRLHVGLIYPYQTMFQDPGEYTFADYDIVGTDGSGMFEVAIPADLPTGNYYLWSAYIYDAASADPFEGRWGLDDTFYFGSDGLPVPTSWYPRETIISGTLPSLTNRPPVIHLNGPYRVLVGMVTNIVVAVTDPDYDAVSVINTEAPAGASFSDSIFRWVPSAADVGTTHSLAFVADDGRGEENSVVTNRADVVVPLDGDFDGLDDGWEWTAFETLAYIATDDPDSDRADNENEYVTGTSANNPDSVFNVELTASEGSGAGYHIGIVTQPGRTYTIYYLNGHLTENPVWIPFANQANGVGTWKETGDVTSTFIFVDDCGPDTTGGEPVEGARMYRIQVKMTPPGVSNTAPTVQTVGNLSVIAGEALAIPAAAQDDGLPSSKLTMQWSKVSGIGTVSFADYAVSVNNMGGSGVVTAGLNHATAIFPLAGTYVLRLTANDDVLTTYEDITVTVSPAASNTPPMVQTVGDQSVEAGVALPIPAAAQDDGLPSGKLRLQWCQISGPGTVDLAAEGTVLVRFGGSGPMTAELPNATATFPTAGTYVLRLSGDDYTLYVHEDITVTVN